MTWGMTFIPAGLYRKFRHPTHYKEHVKKHGEAVQFACDLCEVTRV
jgi:hypothetical protein